MIPSSLCADAHTPVNSAILSGIGVNGSSRLAGGTKRITSILIGLNTCVPASVFSIESDLVDISPKFAAKEIIGVEATSSIEPDYGHLMELFPVRVLIGAPADLVIIFLVPYQPSIVSPSLVALGLSPIVILAEVSLDT